MKTLIRRIGSALAVLLAAAPAFAQDGVTNDVWDISQGTTVTSHTGTVGGFSINDLFGASETTGPESGATIFQDGMPAGFVHAVEWRTAAPVLADALTLLANDDFQPDGRRGFSEFRLFARSTTSGEFEQIFTFTPESNPYDDFVHVTARFAPVTAQDFRAEFVQAGPPGGGGPRVRELDGTRPIREVEGYVLPVVAIAKRNAKTPAKSKLTVGGQLDTGGAVTAFGSPVTLGVGSLTVGPVTPAPKGKGFTFSQGGFAFLVKPSPIGSSRAKFKLAFQGDLTGAVPLDGNLDLGYADSAAFIGGTPELEGGKFQLKRGGEIHDPHFVLVKAAAKVPAGEGNDKLALVVALNEFDGAPTVPFEVRLEVGDTFDVTLPASAFRRQGDRFVLKQPTGGITRAILAFDSGLMTFSGKGLDLGAFADGSNVVRIAVSLGADRRAVTVRLGKAGTALKY